MSSFPLARQFIELDKDNVCCQRDYFDAGALDDEHLPVLGRAIAWLKRRME
jgi:hypothetical protein